MKTLAVGINISCALAATPLSGVPVDAELLRYGHTSTAVDIYAFGVMVRISRKPTCLLAGCAYRTAYSCTQLCGATPTAHSALSSAAKPSNNLIASKYGHEENVGGLGGVSAGEIPSAAFHSLMLPVTESAACCPCRCGSSSPTKRPSTSCTMARSEPLHDKQPQNNSSCQQARYFFLLGTQHQLEMSSL